MLHPFISPPSHLDEFDLPYAERLALWSLRQLIRRESSRCVSYFTRMIWGFGDDVVQLDAAFHEAVGELRQEGVQCPHVGICASLVIAEDEYLLLSSLARIQQDDREAAQPLESILPEGRGRDMFMAATKALAAELAACGYWLADWRSGEPRSTTSASHGELSSVQPVFA